MSFPFGFCINQIKKCLTSFYYIIRMCEYIFCLKKAVLMVLAKLQSRNGRKRKLTAFHLFFLETKTVVKVISMLDFIYYGDRVSTNKSNDMDCPSLHRLLSFYYTYMDINKHIRLENCICSSIFHVFMDVMFDICVYW